MISNHYRISNLGGISCAILYCIYKNVILGGNKIGKKTSTQYIFFLFKVHGPFPYLYFPLEFIYYTP